MRKAEIISLIKEVVSSDIAQSVYGLAKTNNGYYKSDKQASFLKAKLQQSGGVIGSGGMYGNSFTTFADYDDKGITRIYTKGFKTNKETVKWERKVEGVRTQQDLKDIRQYERRIKKLEKSIADRESAKSEYEAKGYMDLYHSRMKADRELLDGLKNRLKTI